MVHGWHQMVHQMALFYPQHPQPSWDFQKPSSRNRGTGFVPPGASSPPLARRCLRRNARKAQLRWTGVMGKNPPGKPGKNRTFSGNNMKSFEDPWKSRKSVGNIWEIIWEILETTENHLKIMGKDGRTIQIHFKNSGSLNLVCICLYYFRGLL